jgi:hypothetical protein
MAKRSILKSPVAVTYSSTGFFLPVQAWLCYFNQGYSFY